MNAVERLRHYGYNLAKEKPWDIEGSVPKNWPSEGRITFEDVSMKYVTTLYCQHRCERECDQCIHGAGTVLRWSQRCVISTPRSTARRPSAWQGAQGQASRRSC